MRAPVLYNVLGMKLRRGAEALVVQVDGLAAQVALVPVRPVVAAHAREPVAGVEALELLGTYLVDVDLAEVDVLDRPHRLMQIRRKDVGGQTVAGVVGEIHNLVEVVEGLDREHGAEHLTLHYVHVVRRPGQHRRLEPVTPLELLSLRASAAEDDVGSLINGALDEGLHLVQLGFVDLRAHLHVLARRLSHPQGSGRLDEALHELLVDAPLHVGALVAGAHLPAIPETRVHSVLDRGVQVGVLEDYERRLPAQLERDRGNILRGRGEDLASTAHRAGHAHHLGYGVANQRVADDPPSAGDDVDYPRGHPDLLDDTGEREGRQRRVLVWLEDDGVARHDGRRHLPGEERRRIVPGDDADHHPVGHRPDEELLVRLVGGEHSAYLSALEGGVVVEEARGRIAYLAARLGYRLALLRDDEAGELLLADPDPLG